MQPAGPNPFPNDPPPKQSGAARIGSRTLKPEPMQATLESRSYGWHLELSPMRAFDALRIWQKLSAAPDSASLLFDVALDVEGGLTRMAAPRGEGSARATLGSIADRHAIPALARFDDDQLVMEPMRLRELIGMIDQAHLRAISVDGPIELRDAAAMRKAIAADRSPLLADFRATAALEVTADRAVTLHSRQKKPALRLIAEAIRLFVCALRDRSATEIALPQPHHIERLMDVRGVISMRPIETESFATFLDIGVSTDAEPFSKPADCSLIYDVPSNSWHDEP